eukprot:m.202188 g.202188  ORF g.202188 m.202188 type:complete len:517 (+) comp18435_c4_seq4:211-1761(+)
MGDEAGLCPACEEFYGTPERGGLCSGCFADEGMRVQVMVAGRDPVLLRVRRTDSVAAIKAQLSGETGIAVERQHLFFRGYHQTPRAMSNERIAQDEMVTDGSVMQLLEGPPEGECALHIVRYGHNNVTAVPVAPALSIAAVKARIEAAIGVPAKDQRLFGSGFGSWIRLQDDAALLVDLEFHAVRPDGGASTVGQGRVARYQLEVAPKDGSNEVVVVTLDGDLLVLGVDPDTSIESFKDKVAHRSGIPVDQHRLIFAGKPLEDGRNAGDYNIQHGATIHLVLRLRGDIGVWDTHEHERERCEHGINHQYQPESQHNQHNHHEHGLEFLNDSCGRQPTLADAHALLNACNIGKHNPFAVIPDVPSVTPSTCAILRETVNEAANRFPTVDDFKLDLTVDRLVELVGERTVSELMGLFRCDPARRCDVVLRRVKARAANGTKACIGFHTDEATRTMQVPLNGDDEYEGGRLTFVTRSHGVVQPTRPAGCATIHDDTILHGVSRLLRGSRYSLFFLEYAN